VRTDLLTPSDTQSACAYKGYASYHSLELDGAEQADVAWFYPEPLRDAERIRDRICFFNERVDLHVDGELQERAVTPWSPRG
jgi:uncharacterized protein (DUF427 family)